MATDLQRILEQRFSNPNRMFRNVAEYAYYITTTEAI